MNTFHFLHEREKPFISFKLKVSVEQQDESTEERKSLYESCPIGWTRNKQNTIIIIIMHKGYDLGENTEAEM